MNNSEVYFTVKILDDEVFQQRIDVFLCAQIAEYSRSKIQRLIKDEGVVVNNEPVTARYKLQEGDVVTVYRPDVEESHLQAEDIPLDIVYEDESLLVLNKAAGIVVHPGAGNKEHTLVNAILHHTKGNLSTGSAGRPGIIHRLDKETSGIIVVAKTDVAHAFMSEQFRSRSVVKEYRAVVKGRIEHDEGYCDVPIGRGSVMRKKVVAYAVAAKEAYTNFHVIERFDKATYVRVFIHTGRTHQIRVHMKYLGFPVFGDTMYGYRAEVISRQCLHAYRITFVHPDTKEEMTITAPLPDDFEVVLDDLRRDA